VSLQGSLRSLSIPDLFSLLQHHKKTGLLSLVSREDERGILFLKGDLVFATSRDASRRLGSFLVSLGFVDEGELGRSAGARDFGVTFLGQELVKKGTINSQELRAAVRRQILDLLDEVLLWEEGAFHFDEWGEACPFDLPADPVIGTQNILLEAIRRYDESKLIRQSFPDLSVILKQVGAPSPAGALGGIAETGEPEAPAGGEKAGERSCQEILQLVDGKRSIGRILRDSARSPYETSIVLTKLSTAGRILPVPERGAIKDLPSIPEPWTFPIAPDTPARLSWIFRQKQTLQRELLAEEVGRDPLLAAKLIQQYGTSRMVLGREQFTVMGILESLGDLRSRSTLIPDLVRGIFFAEKEFFWVDVRDRCARSARLCRTLASQVGYTYLEEAHLAGLLSNLGVFLLLGAYPARYRPVLEEARRTGDLVRLEEAEFGISHATMGGLYAERWKFPVPMLQAIKLHHERNEKSSPLQDLVCLANWLADAPGRGLDSWEHEEEQVEGALRRFKLKKRRVLELVEAAGEPLSVS
jgi:HD-like signal output (HDOD) protein